MASAEIRELGHEALRREALAEREAAVQWVAQRMAVHERARAPSLHRLGRAGHSVAVALDQADGGQREPDPKLSAALGRVLDRMDRADAERLRADAGLGRFQMNTQEWALHHGVTGETALTHLGQARQRLAALRPDRPAEPARTAAPTMPLRTAPPLPGRPAAGKLEQAPTPAGTRPAR